MILSYINYIIIAALGIGFLVAALLASKYARALRILRKEHKNACKALNDLSDAYYGTQARQAAPEGEEVKQ